MQVLQELLSLLEADFQKDQMVWVIQRDPRTKKEKKTMATVRATSGTAVTVSLKDEPNGKIAIDRSQMGPGKAYDLKPRVDEAFADRGAGHKFVPQKKFIVKYKTKDGIATKTLTGHKVAEFKEKFGKDFISAQSAGRVDEAEGENYRLYVEHPYGHGLVPWAVEPGEGIIDSDGNNVEFVRVIDDETILIKRGRDEEEVDVSEVDGVILSGDEQPTGQGWMDDEDDEDEDR